MANIPCFYCLQIGHRIGECGHVEPTGMHNFILNRFINYKLRCLYRTFEEINMDDLNVFKKFSILQLKQLLGISPRRYIFKQKLYARLYKKYDKLSEKIVSRRVDYQALLLHSAHRDEILLEDGRIISNIENELMGYLFKIRNLHGQCLREYILDLPGNISQFIQEQNISLLPIFESRSPLHSPLHSPFHSPLHSNSDMQDNENKGNYKIECLLSNSILELPFECPICQENKECQWKVRLNCFHDFCIGCTTSYLSNVNRRPDCPLCRAKITKLELHDSNAYKVIFCNS